MGKYMLKKIDMVGDEFGKLGKVYNIKKMYKPVEIKTKSNTHKFKYVNIETEEMYTSKKQINKKFAKKPIKMYVLGSAILLIASVYSLLKYSIWNYFVKKEANDDIDTIEEVL